MGGLSNVNTIDEMSFAYCECLSTIKLLKNNLTIGGVAFYCCSALESVTISTGTYFTESEVFYKAVCSLQTA